MVEMIVLMEVVVVKVVEKIVMMEVVAERLHHHHPTSPRSHFVKKLLTVKRIVEKALTLILVEKKSRASVRIDERYPRVFVMTGVTVEMKLLQVKIEETQSRKLAEILVDCSDWMMRTMVAE